MQSYNGVSLKIQSRLRIKLPLSKIKNTSMSNKNYDREGYAIFVMVFSNQSNQPFKFGYIQVTTKGSK